jgi:hypothetical protein
MRECVAVLLGGKNQPKRYGVDEGVCSSASRWEESA